MSARHAAARLPNGRSAAAADAGIGDPDDERPTVQRRSGRRLLFIASPLVLAACLGIITLGASAWQVQRSESRRWGEPLSHYGSESILPRRDSTAAVKLPAAAWKSVAPPSPSAALAGAEGRRRAAGRSSQSGGGPVLARLRAVGHSASGGGHVRIGAPKDESLPPAELKALRRMFHRRKFLFPLLDQGPNNQFLQFRVALQKAHALNRTLVLPIWLPHNPKFLHFHPGAPATASRDKRLEQMWYPFEVAFDAPSLQLYVRIIPLATFRQLTAGKLERCLAHKGGFDVYLRLARLSCESFDELPEQGVAGASEVRERLAAVKDVRFLGFHQYDHELGTRDRHYEYLRWARPVMELASQLEAEIFNGSRYLAAHVRVPDAHWERNDCKHTINGQPAHSVSCGDPLRSINHTSMASEMVHALGTARRALESDGGRSIELDGSSSSSSSNSSGGSSLSAVYLASNMNCSDARVAGVAASLESKHVRLVCAQPRLLELVAHDHFVASLVEQEMCARAHAFVGSKYSTWTDTVLGIRSHAKRTDSSSFEDLWASGVR